MADPVRAFPEAPGGELRAYHPKCPGRLVAGQARVECGQHVERIIRPGGPVYYTALCRLCNELEYSAQWQRRTEVPGADLEALRRERARWERAGHTSRGVADRSHVDRRAGVDS